MSRAIRFRVIASLIGLLVGAMLFLPAAESRAGDSSPLLIGASHTHFLNPDCSLGGTGVVADGGRVRTTIKQQLAAMRAAGIESLRMIVWNAHDTTGQDWGVIPSAASRVVEPYRSNLIHYATDVREAGFKQLTIAFGPQPPNLPLLYGPSGITDPGYDPALFDENWSFIRDVRSLVKNYGPTSTHFDLVSEGVPGPSDDPALAKIADDYITRIYRNYVDAFGSSDVTVSFVGVVGPEDAAGRVTKLVADLRTSGRALPTYFDIHPSYAPRVLDELRAVDNALTEEGLSQPLVIGEEAYNDPAVAHAIATFEATSTRPITEVLEWPLTSDRPCKDISVSAPYRADAYITALTGAPPSTTLTASVASPRQITLTSPYGNPVSALEDGDYTLTVTDSSATANLHLVGPGVNRRTSRRFTGTTSWPLALRSGTYRYGSDRPHSKLRGHFAVLATQKPAMNIALGKPATGSSETQNNPASSADDGLAETFWNAGTYVPQWLQIDLGAPYTIGRIKLIIAQTPNGYTDHQVWVRGASPGDPEQLLRDFTAETTNSEALDYTPPKPINGIRYIRIETLASPSWVAWREIEIFPP
jgi:F5/8 type C domain